MALRTRLARGLACLALLVTAGCGASASRLAAGVTSCTAQCQLGSGARGVSVFVEPEAGASPILSALATAMVSIEVEVYQLSDTRVIHALEDAGNRGVDVRVILEYAPFGDAGVAAQVTAEELRSAGLRVESGNPVFRYTHAKFIVIDHATAYILSANLTHAGLGGSSTSADRDYGVIDTESGDVTEIGALFAADWSRTSVHPVAPDLVVSPDNARAKLLALIASAQHTLYIEDEELQDEAVLVALRAAARRGVVVEVMLPAPSSGAPAAQPLGALGTLAQAHVAVRYSGHLYMHAKLVMVDEIRAFVGSVNFSTTSLDANRELGVLLADPVALNLLAATFAADWRTGAPA